MSEKDNAERRDAIARVAKDVVDGNARNGRNISHADAELRVKDSIKRSETKKERES